MATAQSIAMCIHDSNADDGCDGCFYCIATSHHYISAKERKNDVRYGEIDLSMPQLPHLPISEQMALSDATAAWVYFPMGLNDGSGHAGNGVAVCGKRVQLY